MLLKTFGGLSIVSAGGPTTGAAAQRRRLCLLALLAEAGDRGATREKLVGLLWADSDEERARASLAQALYALRRDLGSEDVIEGTTTLRLDEAKLPSDVGQFRQAAREGRFQAAADLYTGPFLDGVYLSEAPEFERWLDEARAELARGAATVLEQAAARAGSAGDLTAAVALWHRRAALDPLDARVIQCLMRAMAAAGDRAGAIRQAQIHETMVKDELGIAADPAVLGLAEELRRQPAAATAPRAAAPPSPSPPLQLPIETASPPAPEVRPPRFARIAIPAVIIIAILSGGILVARARRDAPAASVPGSAVLAIGAFNGYGPGSEALARAVSDLLSTSLARSPTVTVLSAARMHELAGRGSADAGDSARAMLGAARSGGATHVIDGALYTHQGGVRLDLRRTGVADGRVVQALTIQAADLFAAVDSGTRRLLEPLGPAPTGSVADVTTSSLAAYRLYSAGLREFFEHRASGAYPLFVAALVEDSLFAMAEYQAWLTAPSLDARNRHLVRMVRLAPRASERERLLILWNWASNMDEPASGPLAESLVTRFAAEPFAHLALASTLHAQGRFTDAIVVLRLVLALDRGAPMPVTPGRCLACEARAQLVVNYRLLDSGAAALREARAYTREFPRDRYAWVVLSEQLLSDGQVAGVDDIRRKALELGEPIDMGQWHAYTGMFDMDYARVDAWYIAQLRSGDVPRRRDAAWWLTLSYRAQGRLRDALETADIMRRGSTAFGQQGAAPYEALLQAQVLAEMGRAKESAALYDSIARLHSPGITEARWSRHRAWFLTHTASSRAQAGDTAGLLSLADSIETLGRGSAYARDQRLHHHVRGLVYAARGAHREAAESFRRAIYSPVVGYTRTNLALARELTAQGRPLEAVPWLRAALKGGAEGSNFYLPYTDLHEALALAFEAAGRSDSARTYAAIAVAAWSRADETFASRRARMEILSR